MSLFNKKKRAGFTLIELLVVIAVIGVLAGAIVVAINPTKQLQRARDAKRVQDLRVLSNALQQYLVVNGSMPGNNPSNPGSGWPQTDPAWLQVLVTGGYLKTIPKDPLYPSMVYYYYNYGAGNSLGAFLVSSFEAIDPTTNTTKIVPDSCRPWSGSNWCRSDLATKEVCVCNQY